MSKQGLLWVASKLTRPDLIDAATFNKWYTEEHVADILATSGIRTAFRYANIDPAAERKWLALYPVKDTAWLESQEFADIPLTSEAFKTPGKSCMEVADFDSRYYEYIHGFEPEGTKAGPANLVISAALTPAPGTDEDFDRWYKDEHYRTLSECKGYVRTRRYKLQKAVSAKDAPTYLALHEFNGDSLPTEDLAKSGATPWAQKIMGSLAGQEVFVFSLIVSKGDIKAKF